MPKRQLSPSHVRERLRPTFRAEQIQAIPEIAGFNLGSDLLRSGELVFLSQDQGGPTMIRQVGVSTGKVSGNPVGWKPLPQAGENALDPETWIGCDTDTGELIFLRGRKVCKVSPEGIEVIEFEIEEAIAGEKIVLIPNRSDSGTFLCIKREPAPVELSVFGKDGVLQAGPHLVPDGICRYLRLTDFVLDNENGAGSNIFYCCTETSIHRWDPQKGEVELVAGLPLAPNIVANYEWFPSREGFGSQARFCLKQSNPGFFKMCRNLYMLDESHGLVQLCLQSGEMRRIELVDGHGGRIPTNTASVMIGDFSRLQLFLISYSSFGLPQRLNYSTSFGFSQRLSSITAVDLSTDMTASTVVKDLKAVDWTLPYHQINFDVGEPTKRFQLDMRLLAARSDHFSRVLASGMYESQSGATVQMKSTSVEAMSHFVHYLYTDELYIQGRHSTDATDKELLEQGLLCLAVYKLADQYRVFRLQRLSLLRLEPSLNAATALPLLVEAARDRSWDVNEGAIWACWTACWQHWQEIKSKHGNSIDEVVRQSPAIAVQLLCASSAPEHLVSQT